MIIAVAQTAIRVSEGQISDHVEGGVVVQSHQIDFVLIMFSDLFVQPL